MLMVFSEVGFGSSDEDADADAQASASTETPSQHRKLRVGMKNLRQGNELACCCPWSRYFAGATFG
jgi:hypothetical protein